MKTAQKETIDNRYREWAWSEGHEVLSKLYDSYSRFHLEYPKLGGHALAGTINKEQHIQSVLALDAFIMSLQRCFFIITNPSITRLMKELQKSVNHKTAVVGTQYWNHEYSDDDFIAECDKHVQNSGSILDKLSKAVQGNFRLLQMD